MARRKQQLLTNEQIKEYLAGEPSAETRTAVTRYLAAELERREKAGRRGGRPLLPEKEVSKNALYQRRWRENQKAANASPEG